jgi:ABC-type sugar transport system permease subunit
VSSTASAAPRSTPWLMLTPFLAIFGVFVAFPLFQSISLSMQQSFGPGYTRFVGLKNYRDLLADPDFWTAVRNTFVFTAGSVFIQLPLSLGLALLLNRPGLKGRAFFQLVFFSPALVGVVFVAMIFGVLFEKRTGLVNQTLHALIGWDLDFAWLQTYVMPGLIIAALWQYVGFNMVYFLSALQNVRADLVEAARIDGAGRWTTFRQVIVPEIRPVAGFVVLLSIIGSFQLFELPYVLLNSTAGPDNRGLTMVMFLYQKGFDVGDLGYASAVGWVLGIFLVGFTLLQQRLSRHEVNA